MSDDEKAKRRRVGRPRVNRRRLTRPPAEEILFVASSLFAERGFSGTSTREIAKAAGLQQPTLFHYFPSKEAILEELFARSLQPSLDFAERVACEAASASSRLFRAIVFDLNQLRNGPYNLAVLMSPEARAPRYRKWAKMRSRLVAIYERLIREGSRAGEFSTVDPRVASLLITSLIERNLDSGYGPPLPARAVRTMGHLSEQIATFALRALICDQDKYRAVLEKRP